MAKCFITGTDVPLHEMYLLDISAAKMVVRELKQRLHSLEGLLVQLAGRDETELYNPAKGETFIRYDRRLVCKAASELLGKVHPDERLFVSWIEYRERKASSFLAAARKQTGGGTHG